VRALDRVIAILDVVASSPASVRPAQAAARAGLSLSTVSRVMREMADAGLLERSDGGDYVVGRRLIAIARAGADGNPLIAAALPEMEHLRDMTGETVSLHVRAGENRVCIAEVQSREAVRRVVPVGLTVPLHLGATSSAILAFLAADDRTRVTTTAKLTDPEVEALERRLQNVRDHGIASAVNGWQSGVAGMGAPIFDERGVVGALSVSGPSSRLTLERMDQLADQVRAAAHRISERIGGTGRDGKA
jgi:DNA-binding IclR family transcriptional regulator